MALTEEQKEAKAKADAKAKAKAEAKAKADKKIEEAQALLDKDAKEKAAESAEAAAKAKADAEAAELAALTPEQKLSKDWPDKHRVLAPYITELGKMRGGLNMPDRAEAKKILKGYGFKS